jgi:predicted dehydrogenase
MSEIGVGLVGYKFMGRAHSNAYRQVAHFFDVDPKPKMVAVAGRNEAAVKEAAEQLGWEGYETDYHALVTRDDIGLVDVATPGFNHKEIVIAALEAGKNVLCEKPLANTLDEAQEMLDAARKAGTINVVNFNYRRVPAVQLVKRLIDEGRLGEIRHFRAQYLQDWIMDPEFPLVWRLQKNLAGSGALGDIGAHITDLAMFLVGNITEVVGNLETFIKERPVEVESTGGSGLSAASGKEMGEVTVDDATSYLAKFDNGAMGTFDVTRFAADSPEPPVLSTSSGRSLMNVVRLLTTSVMSPTRNIARSVMCAPMSPSAPEPARSFCRRQTSGNSGSMIQSCRYWPRKWRISPSLPSSISRLTSWTAGTRR